MLRVFLIGLTLLATGGCGSAPRCATIDAQGIADANGSAAQFRAMLESAVQGTVTSAMVMKQDSAAGTENLSKAIDSAVSRHQASWDRNVVVGWSTLGSTEIEQVCAALSNHDQATYMQFAPRVGAVIKTRNEPVLRQAATEVLAEVF